MKLITKQIEEQLNKYPLYSQDGKGGDAVVICKFFLPISSWTWYVTEGEKQGNGDWIFFGIVVNDYGKEYSYFTLRELENIKFPVERDIHFKPTKLKDIKL